MVNPSSDAYELGFSRSVDAAASAFGPGSVGGLRSGLSRARLRRLAEGGPSSARESLSVEFACLSVLRDLFHRRGCITDCGSHPIEILPQGIPGSFRGLSELLDSLHRRLQQRVAAKLSQVSSLLPV